MKSDKSKKSQTGFIGNLVLFLKEQMLTTTANRFPKVFPEVCHDIT